MASDPSPLGPTGFGPTRPAQYERPLRPWEQGAQFRPAPLARPQPKIWLHVLLFVLTVASTTWAVSWKYSASLMLILTCHEFGHYFAAKYHHVKASLPYFVPSPFFLGTFGAVIRMSPFIPNRRALFDIAAAGPIAGLVVALPISFIGMQLSSVQPRAALNQIETITLGDPLIFQVMEWFVFGTQAENTDILLHDMAFAGWVGMFVTALNLLPISQLDGGHVVYAVFGRMSKYVAGAAFLGLAAITVTGGYSYGLFLVLLWFMGVKHPPTMNDHVSLGGFRQKLAIGLLAVFILCFTPVPLEM